MAEAIHVFQTVVSHAGREWTVEAWGEGREDGNRQALVYWAGGLAPTYLEGAFSRAVARAA